MTDYTRPITEELAHKLYDILVDYEAAEGMRDAFVHWAMGDDSGREWRFSGIFGMAGKIWLERDGIRVSGPNVVELAWAGNSIELASALEEANRRVAECLA